MAFQIHRVVQGRPLAGQPHVDRLVRELDVEFPAPETYVLDGELFRARHLRIRWARACGSSNPEARKGEEGEKEEEAGPGPTCRR